MSLDLTPAAATFLRERLTSPLHLDVLLLLHGSPSRWWSPPAVAETLRIGAGAAAHALEALGTWNLVDVRLASTLTYRYAPLDAPMARVIDEIAAAHDVARDVVVALVGRGRGAPR